MVADDAIVTSHVVGIAGILTPVLTPCTIDLTSRGQPKHRPNGMKGARARWADYKKRRPRSRDHETVCVLRSWIGLADRARDVTLGGQETGRILERMKDRSPLVARSRWRSQRHGP